MSRESSPGESHNLRSPVTDTTFLLRAVVAVLPAQMARTLEGTLLHSRSILPGVVGLLRKGVKASSRDLSASSAPPHGWRRMRPLERLTGFGIPVPRWGHRAQV